MLIITSMISISISFPTNINVSKKTLSSQETVSLNTQFLLTFVDNFSSVGTCSIPLPFLYLSSHYHLFIFVLFFNNLKSIHQISFGYKFMPMHLFSSFFLSLNHISDIRTFFFLSLFRQMVKIPAIHTAICVKSRSSLLCTIWGGISAVKQLHTTFTAED